MSDEICDRFCVLGTVEQAAEKLAQLESIGVDQFNIYLMTEGQEQTLETYGREIIPALRKRDWRCSMRKLVQGGTVVTATNSSVADVLIDGEEIVAVGALGDVDAELIDASGCYVLPGLIDNHTHMAMPFGGTHSIDDYDTGTRAAAAGGTTCIVDFVIQQHPDGLRSSLDEWRGRADGAAHVDYGFHMAITQADDGTFADMEPMVEEGICTFKVFLAYKGVLMVTDDLFFRVLETTRDLGALTMVHCENGWVIDVLVERALAAGQTDPIYHALTRPGVGGGRGHEPVGSARGAGGRRRVHRARDLRARGRRDRGRPGARREGVRRDLPPVPDEHGRTTSSDPTSRAAATSARRRCGRRTTRSSCGARSTAACSRASRPTTARSTASRRRSAATTSRRSRTGSR